MRPLYPPSGRPRGRGPSALGNDLACRSSPAAAGRGAAARRADVELHPRTPRDRRRQRSPSPRSTAARPGSTRSKARSCWSISGPPGVAPASRRCRALDALAADLADRPLPRPGDLDRPGRRGAGRAFPRRARHRRPRRLPRYTRDRCPRAFEAVGLPTTVLIDAEGRLGSAAIRARRPWDGPEAKALIGHYLPDAQT